MVGVKGRPGGVGESVWVAAVKVMGVRRRKRRRKEREKRWSWWGREWKYILELNVERRGGESWSSLCGLVGS